MRTAEKTCMQDVGKGGYLCPLRCSLASCFPRLEKEESGGREWWAREVRVSLHTSSAALPPSSFSKLGNGRGRESILPGTEAAAFGKPPHVQSGLEPGFEGGLERSR